MNSVTRPDGASISYLMEGSGPALILHPGISMPGGSVPRGAIEPLIAAGFTVIAVDPRDTGGSTRYDPTLIDPGAVLAGDFGTVPYTFDDMAGDMLAVLDDAGLESATWVGYSMGGNVLASLQAQAPDRVDGLVYLEASPGFGGALGDEDYGVLLRPVPASRDDAVGWALDVLRWTLRDHFDEAAQMPTAIRLVDDLGWWGIPLGHLAASIVGTPTVTTATPDESRTLILYGTGSSDRDISHFEAFAASLPGAKTVEFGPYNHWFPEPGPWPVITTAIIDLANR